MATPPSADDFEALPKRSAAELARLWREQAPSRARRQRPPKARKLLVRDLAWWPQERVYGGFDGETRRLLDAAVRRAAHRAEQPRYQPAPRKQKPRSKKPQLQAGVTLVRAWRGKEYKVKVVEDAQGRRRYRFAGREYRSLSVIAEEITGAHWSGPRFFGLHRVRSTG